ncbi:CHASE2 domain-containing protein [Desulfovibrio inopinatus]|uniref:CHASE2 domain-containing protein n=1 Tax=Desulfovibrio inopinatus TaxID=102109 RepID=UPI000429D001|nr:adenylate/guanylate cyclase domain-containing protein [Desulfovibrio inopinatus]
MSTIQAISKKDAMLRFRSLVHGLFKGHVLVVLAGFLITISVVGLYVMHPSWLSFVDLKIYDIMHGQGKPDHSTAIPVIVDIDEKSLALYGQWPWPRYRIALLLSALEQAGAAEVGVDILFAETDRTSPAELRRQLRKDLDVSIEFQGLPAALEDNDLVLANTLRDGRFNLGYYFMFDHDFSLGNQIQSTDCSLPVLKMATMMSPDAVPLAYSLRAAHGAVCPLPVLLNAVHSAGFFNSMADADNILRRAPLLLLYEGKVYPSLALSTVMSACGVKNAVLKLTAGGAETLSLSSPSLSRREIPMDGRGNMLLLFRGPSRTFTTISAADILDRSYDPEKLRGHIVYVGTSAAGLRDLRATPVDSRMPGVEIHATVTDMILAGDFIRRPDWAPGLEVVTIVCVGLFSAVLITWTRAVVLILPFLALSVGMWFGATWIFNKEQFFLSPLYPYIVLAGNFMALTFMKFWREEQQKRYIHSAFSQYLSPAVIEEIMASPEKLTLSGEEKEISILFSDVRGFTSISERLTPTRVVDLLQAYFTPMTRIITSSSGTIDKFIGDAIMAFWNAPLDIPDHPRRAVTAAMAMVSQLEELNKGFVERFDGVTIDIGIGLHRGMARVGNFGSADLFDYTLIGDNVNLCSRLEGLTKYYGLKILVSESMILDDENIVFLHIDRVRVKGKEEAVDIYTVMNTEEARLRHDELVRWNAAWEDYRQGDFESALRSFKKLFEEFEAKLYEVFLNRTTFYCDNRPTNWDGVYSHVTK